MDLSLSHNEVCFFCFYFGNELIFDCCKQIVSIQGLETLVCLKRLDLSFNRIRKLDGLAENSSLEWLDLRANSLSNVDELAVLTKVCETVSDC